MARREYWGIDWADSYLSKARYEDTLSLAQSFIRVAGLRPLYVPSVAKDGFWTGYKLFILRDGEQPDTSKSAVLRPAYSVNEEWIAFICGNRADLPGDGYPLLEAVQKLVARVKGETDA